MARLFLVRHGETDWNRNGQIMGARPIPLNHTGKLQAQRLASMLKGYSISRLHSSPVERARQTAEILASALGLSVTIDPGLREIGMGTWEGLYWHDLADDIARINFYLRPHEARPPQGETFGEVQNRAVETVERLLNETTNETILLVSHADVLRAILAHYLRFDLASIRQIRIDHASLTALELIGSSAELLFLNYFVDR